MTGDKQSFGTMYQGEAVMADKIRYDIICKFCRVHTIQVRVDKGWKCKLCNNKLKEEK